LFLAGPLVLPRRGKTTLGSASSLVLRYRFGHLARSSPQRPDSKSNQATRKIITNYLKIATIKLVTLIKKARRAIIASRFAFFNIFAISFELSTTTLATILYFLLLGLSNRFFPSELEARSSKVMR
jgi:hypothetical protein